MRHDVVKVFVGFDPVESVAWHTMVHSIFRHSTKPVAIVPLKTDNMSDIYTRPRDPKQSNEFSFTRFLIPYLSDYCGYSLFFDCDMLLRDDICNILDVLKEKPEKAVYVVKHTYKPREDVKYLNTIQYKYPRKNWSSVVLWNCAHPANKIVTPEFVNSATGLDLHRFTWLKDDEIGELDIRWNWLVGEYDDPPEDVKNVHWTNGGPYFHEFQNVDFANEWQEEHANMSHCLQRTPLKK